MKRLIVLTTCIFTFSTSFAQRSAKAQNDAAKAQRNLVASGKCALTGHFSDARFHPFKGVEAFIYAKDSSIAASGYTDSTGYYETNSVPKGSYDVKLVFPSKKTILITGYPLKPGFNELSLQANAPEADTTMAAAALMPKPVEKKTTGSKKK